MTRHDTALRHPRHGRRLASLALAAVAASGLVTSPAQAQDTHTRWLEESEWDLLGWAARETRHEAGEVLYSRVMRSDDGVVFFTQHGLLLEDERATAVFARHYRARDYSLTPMDGPPEGEAPDRDARLVACQQQLDRCRASARACTASVRACVFGEQRLAEGDGAELWLMAPQPPMGRRSGTRSAELRWQGQSLRVQIPASNPIDEPSAGEYGRPSLRVRALSARRRVLVLRVREPGVEDPPQAEQFFLHRGGELREIQDPVIASFRYDARLPGDGTIVVDENPYSTCERLGYPERAPRSRVVVRVADDGQVRSARRQRRRGHWECRELPACPFVDRVDDAGEMTRLGEILRNVRFEPETQELAVGVSTETVRIRISEEKPEVTYLDAVALRIGEELLLPRACNDERAPYCTRDGDSLQLDEGQTLELEFDVPARLLDEPAFLHAHGMYIPLE